MRRSGRTALLELIFAIAIFCFAAAISVRIFVSARSMADESARLNSAVVTAQNGCECFRAASGDLEKTAELLGGSSEGEVLTYNTGGNTLTIEIIGREGGLVTAALTVSDADGEIYALQSSALEVPQ